MKVAIVVALLCVAAYASAENTCQCSSFFHGHVDEAYKIFTAPNVELASCDAAEECKTSCQTKFNQLTDGGNLLKITSKGTTVAQYSCDKVKLDIADGQMACYYKLCDGAWTHVEDTKGKTCCSAAGLEVPC